MDYHYRFFVGEGTRQERDRQDLMGDIEKILNHHNADLISSVREYKTKRIEKKIKATYTIPKTEGMITAQVSDRRGINDGETYCDGLVIISSPEKIPRRTRRTLDRHFKELSWRYSLTEKSHA